MKVKARIFPVLLLALMTAACHSTKPVPTTGPDHQPPADLPRHREYTVIPFSAVVEGYSVNGQLRMAADSVMWVSVSKFIEVGRGMVTPDSLFLHSAMLGREEAIDYADLRHRTGLNLDFGQLQHLVLQPDAGQRIQALANGLGVEATVQLGTPRHPDQLTFPYTKPAER